MWKSIWLILISISILGVYFNHFFGSTSKSMLIPINFEGGLMLKLNHFNWYFYEYCSLVVFFLDSKFHQGPLTHWPIDLAIPKKKEKEKRELKRDKFNAMKQGEIGMTVQEILIPVQSKISISV